MGTHKRKLKMHQNLLYSVIQRQAGTIAKAILEGAMNSADAGSPDCHIRLTSAELEIQDSGRGFKNLDEIDKFFETFGQPHEEHEEKIYGTFRMGRGQLFAFGHNIWRTENFLMDVDFKNKGDDWLLTDDMEFAKGCHIKIKLYDKLLPSELAEVKREVERYVKYMPIEVTFNGKRISVDLEKEKWDHVTPEGYVKLKRTGDLEVYNLGVYVKGYSNYGTGGIVVSKKQLKVNFARNDVMQSECPVWKKLRKFVNVKSTQENIKRKELNEDERKNIALKFVYGELTSDEVRKVKIFTDVKGRHYALDKFRTIRGYDTFTFVRKHNNIGDKIHQQKLAFVLAEENLDRFECDEQSLVDLINASGVSWNTWKFVPFSEVSASFSERHDLIDPSEWTAYERIAIDLIGDVDTFVLRMYDGRNNYDYHRRALLGSSETSTAWTDGKEYIAYKREWIRSKFQPLTFQTAVDVAGIMLHEYCHDSSDHTGHGHPPEFYEKFHEYRNLIGQVADGLIRNYEKALERENRTVTKKFAKIQDRIVKNEEAVRKLNEKLKKSADAEQKHAAIAEVKQELKTPKKKTAPKAKRKVAKVSGTKNPYSGKYGILYANAKKWIDRETLLETVSEITGQTIKQVKMALSVLGNPNHRSNKGKTKREVKGNKIRIIPV